MKRLLLLLLLLTGCVRPLPGPTPEPPKPDVSVTISDGRYGLAPLAYKSLSLVKSKNRDAEAAVIAKAHHDAAVAAGKSPYVIVPDLIGSIRTNIGAELSNDARAAWQPWSTAIVAKLNELQTAGTLVSREDWIDALNEIASGVTGGK